MALTNNYIDTATRGSTPKPSPTYPGLGSGLDILRGDDSSSTTHATGSSKPEATGVKPKTPVPVDFARDAIDQARQNHLYATGQNRQMDTSAKIWWNPPPHLLTKPPRIEWGHQWDASEDLGSHVRVVERDGEYFREPDARGRLGAIYTRGSDDNGSRWGCRFHYNPTSLSLGAEQLHGSDMTTERFVEDSKTMNPVGNFGYMSVELYFNRIYDLAFPGARYYSESLESGANSANENQAEMLRRLGTNYDIEYLYRIVNGDPRPNSILGYHSADMGVLLWRPVEFHLGPFKYMSVITSLSINHILFTPTMVPTFTTVSLGFLRFPGDYMVNPGVLVGWEGEVGYTLEELHSLSEENRAAYNIGQPGR